MSIDDMEEIDDWKRRSELGEVCGILGCPNIPVRQCYHCQNHYCEEHKPVIGFPSHRFIEEAQP